ncbi:hypothetical protein SBOR_2955 [Sclerotinia borealis F-4128]|uniref:ubiquitinyl hydrolase 1 n=1 Tax=Sclerotinia borealis (strain F-4128) TaxID=1432307 RepID=W9CLG4_SCLBF|nr:hypothetical protein SBOR_2955 [Sclerotinia borealis F-4128]
MFDYEMDPGPGEFCDAVSFRTRRKTAPRLVNDLLDYDLRRSTKTGKHILIDPAPIHNDAHFGERTDPSGCRHELYRKDLQTASLHPHEDPDPTTICKIAAFCFKCRYHFLITVDYRDWKDGQTPCNSRDPENPLHHFRVVDSRWLQNSNGVCNFVEHRFACTAATCPVKVEVKISPPRLFMSMVSLLTDLQNILGRGQKEIEADPKRFEGHRPLYPIQVLGNLRTYLQDAGGETRKQIARRNKKFRLAFGDDCDSLLKYLGFELKLEPSSQPEDEFAQFWTLPAVDDENRDFIDDVKFELNQLMSERPIMEQNLPGAGRRETLTYALADIRQSLACNNYPQRNIDAVQNVETVEHPYYASLGAMETFTDDLLAWSYDRQCQCDPKSKPYYLDCLRELGNGRLSSDLQTKAAMIVSTGEVSLKDIEKAYSFFALQRSAAEAEADDYILGVFKSRIDSAPRQKDEARECLLVIAKDRQSNAIEAVANDRSMTFEEALEFLSVSSDTASDSIEAAAVAMSFEGDKNKVAKALRAIANKRGDDYTLQRAATSMESGTEDPNLDVGEAYNRLQINDRRAPDDTVLAYYESLRAGAPAGSSDSYTEAFRVIAHDRQSSYLLRKLDDPKADIQAEKSTVNQPIGLDNIGNTCYLNSLLQYYYTVKSVRDVVMNFDQNRMSLNEEDIKKKRVGGRAVSKAEIIKAQKFVTELHDLFENLKTASTKSIKPTRELAELTIFSSAAEANFRRASISSPSGPPNIASMMSPIFGPEGPPNTTFSPPPSIDDDIEMVDRPEDKVLNQRDDSSECTLVDAPDMDGLPPYLDVVGKTSAAAEKVWDIKTEDTSSTFDDAVMVNGDSISPASDIIPAAPDKPPPIPPRNKAGLSIQTNDHKEVITDDDLWKFGSQQDVTEVIGNVMFRLQCAIKPTSIDPVSGEQIDNVRDTFYGANASYLRKSQKLEKKVEPWANLIIFPDENKPRDIYEALDVVFDEQQVHIDGTVQPQYASITKLPPILQVQIQRTRYDNVKHTAYKNRNAVIFPETIYLDRYMDSEDSDSTLMRRRQEAWKWKTRINTLEERQKSLGQENTAEEISVCEALSAANNFTKGLQEMNGVEVDADLVTMLEERQTELIQEIERNDEEIQLLKQKRNEQFTNMTKYEYKLQTVFIHRGEAGGGHYWIYIYDFENDIWREYNDEYVTEVRDRRRIFEHEAAGASGTPYYLGYVRSSDVMGLVGAVHRELREVEMSNTLPVAGAKSWARNLEDGVEVRHDEDVEMGEVRHLEYVNPRQIMPKTDEEDKTGVTSQLASDAYEAQW